MFIIFIILLSCSNSEYLLTQASNSRNSKPFVLEDANRSHNDSEIKTQIIADIQNVVRGSTIGIGIAVRYPNILSVIIQVFKTVSHLMALNQTSLCLEVGSRLKNVTDSCNSLLRISSREAKICMKTEDGSSILPRSLLNICNTSLESISTTTNTSLKNRTTLVPKPPPVLPGGRWKPNPTKYLLIAIKIIARVTLLNFQRKCEARNGVYDGGSNACIFQNDMNNSINSTLQFGEASNPALNILSICGHVSSCMCLLILCVTFIVYKKHHTLPGKNIMSLSISLVLASLVQLLIIYLGKSNTLCTIFGVSLHFCLLLSFLWMALISYDFFITFNKSIFVTQSAKKTRFKMYCLTAYSFPALLVLICLVLDIPNGKITNYGVDGKCFVARFWTNLFTFVAPVGLILAVNCVLLFFTMKSLVLAKRASNKLSAQNRRQLVLTTLALKISVVVGIAWILAFVDGFVSSRIIEYIYTFVVTFQGVFIYLAFGCYGKLLRDLRGKCCIRNVRNSQRGNVTVDTRL